ncbi:hypothetical protein [Porphyromonas loveana]|uniref:hypothetical protein n=1 Tax=Porphyromonas loveana TaxID=1884669 RepID=UPI00359FB6AE
MVENHQATNRSMRGITPAKDSVLAVFLQLCLKNWYWILLSVCVFGVWGVISSKRAGVPSSVYFTAVMARYPENIHRSTTGGLNPKYSLHDNYTPRWEGVSVLDRDPTFNGLCATSLVEEVGAEIQFDVNYYLPGRFANRDIYDTTPIHLIFPKETAMEAFSVKMKLEQDKATILSLKGKHMGKPINLSDIVLRYGEPQQTPIGDLIVEKTEYFADGTWEEKAWPINLLIAKESQEAARVRYDTNLKTEELKGRIEMRVTMNRTIGFARDFLDGLIRKYDELARSRHKAQVEEKIALTEQGLRDLQANNTAANDSTFKALGITDAEKTTSREAMRLRLTAMLDEYKVDALAAESSSSLIVLDKTKSVPGANKEVLSIILSVLIGFFLPLVVIFASIILRNLMLVPSDLGEDVLKHLLSRLTGNKKKKATRRKDIDLLRLNLTEYLADKSAPCIVLSSLSGDERIKKMSNDLLESFEQKGMAMQIVKTENSNAATKEIATLQQKGIAVLVVAPAIARSASAIETSLVADVSLLLVESLCSKKRNKEDAENFILQSRCPAFVIWMDRF